MAGKTRRWLKSLITKNSSKPDTPIPPGTGVFVQSAVHDAIYGDSTIITPQEVIEEDLPGFAVTACKGFVHVNYRRSELLCLRVVRVDPITKKLYRVRLSGSKKHTTKYYRGDGTIYDGLGPYEL